MQACPIDRSCLPIYLSISNYHRALPPSPLRMDGLWVHLPLLLLTIRSHSDASSLVVPLSVSTAAPRSWAHAQPNAGQQQWLALLPPCPFPHRGADP